MMRLVLDFDNTIANYNALFPEIAESLGMINKCQSLSTKVQTKIKLASHESFPLNWQKLQGQVYGPFMHKAHLFDGFRVFEFLCQLFDVEVFIVSHKTEYGHFDDSKTSLRRVSDDWMLSHNLFGANSHEDLHSLRFYCDSIDEKISIINSLRPDCILDDLLAVLEHPELNRSPRRILFQGGEVRRNIEVATDYLEVVTLIFGEVDEWWDEFASRKLSLEKSEIVNRSTNSICFRARGKKNLLKTKRFVKFANRINSDWPAVEREVFATNFFSITAPQYRFQKIVNSSKDFYFIEAEWVDSGREIQTEKKLRLELINVVVSMMNAFRDGSSVFEQWPNDLFAKEALLSLDGLKIQLESRLGSFNALIDAGFLDEEDELNQLVKRTLLQVDKEYFDFEPALSLGDWGMHNVLRKDKDWIWLDLAYAGIDDRKKIILDFLFHPGNRLTETEGSFFLDLVLTVTDIEKNQLTRLLIFFAIRWILIISDGCMRQINQERLMKDSEIWERLELCRSIIDLWKKMEIHLDG